MDKETTLRAYSILNIKGVDEVKRTITGVATTPTPDRVGDVVNPLGAEFKNPLPLLWQHKSDKPVGLVKFGKPTKNGIDFEAVLPRPEEIRSQVIRDRVEEALDSVRLGLVRGASIGFRPKKFAFMEDGGIEFQETEIFELSLVTIPANAEATIDNIKSLDMAIRDKARTESPVTKILPVTSGNITPKAIVPPKGDNAVQPAPVVKASPATRKDGTKMPKTIAEQISATEASRAALIARMTALMDGVSEKGETLNDEEAEEYDTAKENVKKIDAHLVRLREQQDLVKTALAPVDPPEEQRVVLPDPQKLNGNSGGGVRISHVKANLPEGATFCRLAHAMLAGKGDMNKSIRWAKHAVKFGGWSNTPEIVEMLEADLPTMMEMTKAAVGAGTTTDATWASPLINYNIATEQFINYLRGATIIGRIPGLRRVPFNIQVPRMTSGTSAGWVGENAPKPVSAGAFDSVTLRWAKAAGIVVLTDELVRFSSPAAEQVVRQDLTNTITAFIDRQFVDPSVAAVTNVSPASVLNGVSAIVPTGTTMAAFRSDLKRLFATMTALNLPMASGVFIMHPDTALGISLTLNSLGQPVYPTIRKDGGELLGYPVITSTNIPSTTGSPTEGYPIIFLLADEIMLADDGQTVIDASNQASIQLDSAPDSPPGASTAYISMWQMNMTALRAERWINWVKRRTGVAQFIQSALYAE